MYVAQASWIEAGPQRRPVVLSSPGLGTLDQAAQSVTVSACAPDICVAAYFPWIGRRSELAAGEAQPVGSFESAESGCYCKPVFELPRPWGLVATGVLGALLVFKIAKGRG